MQTWQIFFFSVVRGCFSLAWCSIRSSVRKEFCEEGTGTYRIMPARTLHRIRWVILSHKVAMYETVGLSASVAVVHHRWALITDPDSTIMHRTFNKVFHLIIRSHQWVSKMQTIISTTARTHSTAAIIRLSILDSLMKIPISPTQISPSHDFPNMGIHVVTMCPSVVLRINRPLRRSFNQQQLGLVFWFGRLLQTVR